MLIKNIRHLGLVVTDMERALKFYHELLGLKIQGETEEEGLFIDTLLKQKNSKLKTIKLSSEDNATRLELISYENKLPSYNKKQLDQSGLTHISLTVHNLDETYSILKERGIEFNCPPTLSVNQNLKVTFCRDFEGNFLELTEEIP